MLKYLWDSCLFPPPEPYVKSSTSNKHGRWKENSLCKTPKSRSMALKLLAELANGCPENLAELVALLFAYHEKCKCVVLFFFPLN